jgi:hypothetical protein
MGGAESQGPDSGFGKFSELIFDSREAGTFNLTRKASMAYGRTARCASENVSDAAGICLASSVWRFRAGGRVSGPCSARRVRRNKARGERSELRDPRSKRSSPGRGDGIGARRTNARTRRRGQHPPPLFRGLGFVFDAPEFRCASLRAIFHAPPALSQTKQVPPQHVPTKPEVSAREETIA